MTRFPTACGVHHHVHMFESFCSYHDRPIYDIAWSQSGLLATAGGDNKIVVMREEVRHMLHHKTPFGTYTHE
jgi:hypothetical protein